MGKHTESWLTFWLSITLVTLVIVLGHLATNTHPADACQEDGAWIAVDHHDADGVEDSHGVTRACRSIDDLLDSAVEVWIQNNG